ncbi:hypothetical protein E2C05_29620 [Paracraurococcus ruber]|uniref:hypothetical protein n=1 Tax=Paracraurococcus ruber TaxID=77675 RepID=UPI00105761D7|nr:hypothetical protein [Paracraurococcus ruber]TDG16166.1 hypothetical protein E2C05_29620 [Paracraurococcus ruber]
MSSAGIEFRTAPVAPPAWRIDAATHRLCLALLLAAALALQSGLAGIGFLRLGADESARTLMALQLTWANALEPYIWPPFTKLLLGLALQVWPDPVLVPRLLASVAGLLTILAVVRLSDMIFGDRRIGLLAGLLSLLIPHRLIFATVPMSDIYAHLFLLLAAGCVLAWLRHGSVAQLLLGCLCVLLAETVRFEAALFGGTIGLLVLHRWLWRRELRAAPAILAGLLLGSFPLLWVLDTWAWYGSLEALSLTSRQYTAVLGTDRRLALYLSPLGRNLALDILWNPLLPAGVLALAWRLRRDAALRPWAAAFGAPLPLLTATMVLTFSIPTAAPWRTTGLWVLALLPFQASAMLWLARAAARFVPPRLAVAALLALALLPMAGRSALYVASGMRDPLTGGLRQEATAGRAALRLLGPDGGQVLVDSRDNIDFLDVLVLSGAPDRFAISHGADPVVAAEQEPQHGPGSTEDRFALAGGGDAAALAAADIRRLLLRDPALRAAVERTGAWAPRQAFGPWALYAPVPPAVAERPARPGDGG